MGLVSAKWRLDDAYDDRHILNSSSQISRNTIKLGVEEKGRLGGKIRGLDILIGVRE